MVETLVHVECYCGYRGGERPRRFVLAGRVLEVTEVEDRWYSPGASFFRVVASDGNRYVLRQDEAQDVWTLEAFRATRFIRSSPALHEKARQVRKRKPQEKSKG